MTDISVIQHIQELEEELAKLNSQAENLKQKILEVKLKFELDLNSLQKIATKELQDSGYTPTSMNLSLGNAGDDLKITNKDIEQALNLMYKTN